MLQLQMQSVRASLDIYPAHTQLNLKTNRSSITQTQPALILDITGNKLGKLEIDNTQARYVMGMKNISDFRRDEANAGKQAVSDYIDRMVSDGNRMMQIEKGFTAIPDMAYEAINPDIPSAPTIVYKPGPDVTYTPNTEFKINWREQKATLQHNPATVENNTQAAKVNINVADYGSLKIWTIGQITAGVGVDIKA